MRCEKARQLPHPSLEGAKDELQGGPKMGAEGWLFEMVGAAASEGKQAEVAQDLQLLADFVADMVIVGVESCKVRSERIGVI